MRSLAVGLRNLDTLAAIVEPPAVVGAHQGAVILHSPCSSRSYYYSEGSAEGGTFREWSQSVGTHVLHGDPLSAFALPDGEELAEQLDSVRAVVVEVVGVLDRPPVLEPVECLLGLLLFHGSVNVCRCSEDDASARRLSSTKAVRLRHAKRSAPLASVFVLPLPRRIVEEITSRPSCPSRRTSLHPCSFVGELSVCNAAVLTR